MTNIIIYDGTTYYICAQRLVCEHIGENKFSVGV